MNTLVIGPFDGTGYGGASTDLALALDACGAHVVCRRLRLDGRDYEPPARLRTLLGHPHARPYDACLQVLLPHQMRRAPFPTFGYFFWETDHFRNSSWPRALDRLDGVIVPAGSTRNACTASGVRPPVRVVPLPADVSRYERDCEPLPALAKVDAHKFYTVGEFTPRKDLKSVLTAYYLEFRRSESVHFVVKADKPGVAPGEFQNEFARWNHKLKESLKLHRDPDRYPPVTLVNQRLTDDEMVRLHRSCDTFVQASRGEGWGRVGFDAMALGRTPVVPLHTGYLAWADESVVYAVGSASTNCSGAVDSFCDLYRGDEEWRQADIGGLRRAMRLAFADEALRRAKARAGLARAYQFSYEAVGPRLLEVLTCRATSTGPTCATTT